MGGVWAWGTDSSRRHQADECACAHSPMSTSVRGGGAREVNQGGARERCNNRRGHTLGGREMEKLRGGKHRNRLVGAILVVSVLYAALPVCGADNVAAEIDGTCRSGYHSCLELGYGEAYQKLGSDPVKREDWNRTYFGKEYVEAASATGCVFHGNDTLVFANTQYKNILVFETAHQDQPWERTNTWPTPCAPRGLARLPNSTNVLFACTDEGKIYNLSYADGTISVLSSGIDFSPNNPLFRKSKYALSDQVESSIMQCATTSHNMMIDIIIHPSGSRASLSNKNYNHIITIDLSLNEFSGPASCSTAANCAGRHSQKPARY